MKAVKYFRIFFAVIFVILFGFILTILMSVLITRDLLSEQSIDKYVEANEIFDSKSEEVFTEEGSSNTLRQEINQHLIKIGISETITNEALNSKEMDNILSSYVYNYINYLLFDKERPVFPSDKVVQVIINTTNKNNKKLNNNQTKLLNEYIKILSTKVDSAAPSIYQLNSMGYDAYSIRLMAAIIFSSQILIVLIFLLVLLTILIGICLWNKLKALNKIAIAIEIVGVLFIIGSFMEVRLLNMLINSNGLIDGLILNVMSKSFAKLLIYGSILIIIGIIILIICGILIKKEKKKTSLENSLNNTLTPSVKDNLKDHILTNNFVESNEISIPKTKEENIKETTETSKETINNSEKEEKLPDEISSKIHEESKAQDNASIEIAKEPELENIDTELIEIESLPEQNLSLEKAERKNELETIEIESLEEDQKEKTPEETYDPSTYIEMDEEVEDIIKQEPNIITPKNININLVSPKKGPDIKVELDKEEEEDIEIL